MITFSFSGQTYQTGRIIGNLEGSSSGPALMFFGAVHGNEPSGVVALQEVFAELESNKVPLAGKLMGVAGNLSALAENRRYIAKDLNRIWTRNQLQNSDSCREALGNEYNEQQELHHLIQPLLEGNRPAYFLDLHTTSSDSAPFIAINDQLENRRFAMKIPVPTVLGIEEFLEGPLLSYLNEFGPVALAFEAGQHDNPESAKTHKSFIYRAMVASGIMQESDIPQADQGKHQAHLENLGRTNRGFYEVVHKRTITNDDNFSMNPGYQNLTSIKKGEILAKDRNGQIQAPVGGRIFMPLYQSSGNDGFFVVRKIPAWAIVLSRLLRNLNFDTALTLLPGVSRHTDHPESLVINKKVARFLAKQIFHLLGYRRKKDNGDVMIFSRREIN
ncbi:MAG: succinylglutamate desuccinylase/aspartoacylase family protein [Mariniblastus sp.]|nr:succinylglutamate desuccinylase/aspartoacylase family protein [Mariniblastus sp.]